MRTRFAAFAFPATSECRAETCAHCWRSMSRPRIRRNRCPHSIWDSRVPGRQPESANPPDRAARASRALLSRTHRKHRVRSLLPNGPEYARIKSFSWIASMFDHKSWQVFLGLSKCNVRDEERRFPAYFTITSRTRFPRTARTKMLASTARLLPGIPLFLAGSAADPFVLLH